MELRHLRYFIAVAEELSFSRAAERLHIEQSPLSRRIRVLEDELGVRLFERNSHGVRLTWPGQVFLEDARRVLATMEQARANVRAAASGYRGMLRVALSDGIMQLRLSALLAQCRADEPEVEIRLFEVPLAVQLKGLRDDLYDIGFARTDAPGEGLTAVPVWNDSLVVVMPARHPLLRHQEIPLNELLRFPLIMCDPESCEGCSRQVGRVLRTANREPEIAELVSSHDLLMTLVAAGFGLGLASESHLAVYQHPEIVARPLAGEPPILTTYVVHRNVELSEQLARFVLRANPPELG